MKYYLIFYLVLSYSFSIAQKYDFNSELESTLTSDITNIKLSSDFGQISNIQQSLKFIGPQASIIFSNIRNPKEIRFDFLPELLDGQLNLTILYRKSGNQEFIEFPNNGKISLNKNPNTKNFLEYFIPSLLEGTYDIKIFFESTHLAYAWLDNLEFIQYQQKEIEELEKNRKYIADVTSLTTRVISTSQILDYNNKVDIVKKGYVDNIDKLRELSYRANVLASLSTLFVFVNQRTKMSVPSNYSLFNEKIDFIKSNCNKMQLNYLDRIIADIKLKELKTPEQTSTKSGIMKFINVAGEVGNIVSGGQLKSVVNSIQGLITNIFDPNKIKIETPEVIKSIKKGEVISAANPEFDITKVNGVMSQGIELQNFFYNFFDKLEEDSIEFNNLVEEFKDYSEKTNPLLEEIELLRKDYFLKVKYEMTDDFYNNKFLAYPDTTTDKHILNVKNISTQYFNKLIIPTNSKGEVTGGEREVRLKDLEDANNLIKRVIELGQKYKMYATELKNLFSKVDLNLKKENLFSKYDEATKTFKKDDSFKKSYEEYEGLKNNAQTTFNQLKTSLEIVLK